MQHVTNVFKAIWQKRQDHLNVNKIFKIIIVSSVKKRKAFHWNLWVYWVAPDKWPHCQNQQFHNTKPV